MRRSAVGEGTKVATTSDEIMRRIKTTDTFTSGRDMKEILTEYMDNLIGMGYSYEWRVKVLTSTLVGYRRILKLVDQGKTDRNRLGGSSMMSRRFKRLLGPTMWFKNQKREREKDTGAGGNPAKRRKLKGKEGKQPDAVMFIPATRNSILKTKLQTQEEMMNLRQRVKYVETMGINIGESLFKKNPWQQECGREKCILCRSSPGKCTKRGVVYRISCTPCQEMGVNTAYYGESNRTCYDRGIEHLALIEARSLESPFVEHFNEHHREEQDVRIKMNLVSQQIRPLERQTLEGLLISESKVGTLLNKKGEWGENLPPKFEIVDEMSKKRAPETRGDNQGRNKRQRAHQETGQNDERDATVTKTGDQETLQKSNRGRHRDSAETEDRDSTKTGETQFMSTDT